MSERSAARAREASESTNDYIRSVAGTSSAPSAASEIESAKRLLDTGAITAEEYGVLKANALRVPA